MGLAGHYYNRSGGKSGFIYLMLELIDWICARILRLIKTIFNQLKKIDLKSFALIVSLLTNLFLVWIGALTIEHTNRPIVHVKSAARVNEQTAIQLSNSGRVPTSFHLKIYSLEHYKTEDTLITCYFVSADYIMSLYPGENKNYPHLTLDSLINKNPHFEHVIKIKWEYNSLIPDLIPGISSVPTLIKQSQLVTLLVILSKHVFCRKSL